MQIRIVEESDIAAELDANIKSALCRCFPEDIKEFSQSRGWNGCMPAWSVIIRDNDDVIAHLGITNRTILVRQQPYEVAGVHNVFVLPEYRGKGLVRKLLESAMPEARKREYDLGLLFCKPDLEMIYAHFGWITIGDRAITCQSGGEKLDPKNNLLMYYPLGQKELPEGEINLQGNIW